MKRIIILALSALVGLSIVAPVASAAPYLSMSKAKKEMLSFTAEVAGGIEDDDNFLMDFGVRYCERISKSSVECTSFYEYFGDSDMTCESTLRATSTRTSFVRIRGIGEVDCF